MSQSRAKLLSMTMWSRRSFVCWLPALLGAETGQPPSDLKRLRDPATEFEIFRYTDPAAYSSFLLPGHLRSVSAKSNFVLICSDRSGTMQLYRLDLEHGIMRQLTNAEKGIRLGAAALSTDDRTAYCLHENALVAVSISGRPPRTLYEAGDGWSLEALAPDDDGRTIFVLERKGDSAAVREVNFLRRTERVAVERSGELTGLRPRPRAGGLAFRSQGRLWLSASVGANAIELKTPAAVRQALWSANGRSLIYITIPEKTEGRVQLREHFPDTSDDRLIANTSQYVSFARNADSSVFAGVSGSKASPHILLLLRMTRRELTVAEHRASEPAGVVVIFTPDSRRILYHTDRAGRSAIYAIPAEKLVEPTDN